MDKELTHNFREDRMRMRLADLNRLLSTARLGGGKERIDKEHAKGKWTARERLDRLFDDHCERLEIGALAGHGMYKIRADVLQEAWSLKLVAFTGSRALWSPMTRR